MHFHRGSPSPPLIGAGRSAQRHASVSRKVGPCGAFALSDCGKNGSWIIRLPCMRRLSLDEFIFTSTGRRTKQKKEENQGADPGNSATRKKPQPTKNHKRAAQLAAGRVWAAGGGAGRGARGAGGGGGGARAAGARGAR